jgi:hypothetical protein
VYPTLVSFPLRENECLHIFLAKTEPWWLGLGFWPQLGPPSCITQSLAPTTLNTVYSTPIGPPLPENKFPHVSLVKTEPQRLCFAFWFQLHPPSRIARSHHPTTSNPVYACQMGFPLPESESPHIALAKTEPRRLGFGFWLQLSPSSHIARSHHPTTSNPVYSCQIGFYLPENDPPTLRWNLALTHTHTPLVHCPIPPHHHLKPGEPHPNKVSCT